MTVKVELGIGTMERQHKKPAANTGASFPAGSGSSSSSRWIHGSMSSAFLGVSSSTHFQTQRRLSPSLCPPPAPAPLPGLLASRGSADASSGSASGWSSSQFHQISPSPRTAVKRRPRPSSQITHSLPSPFFSELSAIRRISTNLSLSYDVSHHHTEITIRREQQQAVTMGSFPGFEPAPLQQEPSFSSLQHLPIGNFSGFPLPTSQPQQMQPSFPTDLPSMTFSMLEPLPVASQHFSTYVEPLPSRTTIFQSSSSSCADHASLPNPWHGKPNYLQGSGSGSDAKGLGVGCQTLETMSMSAIVHDKVNNAGGRSSCSSITLSCHGSTPMYSRSEEQSLQQLSHLLSLWSSTASSSRDQSMASSVPDSNQGWAAVPALATKFDMMSIGGTSCSAGPQMQCNYSSVSMENSTTVPAMPKQIPGGIDRPGLPPRSPALGAGTSSSMPRRGCTKEHFFSEADTEKISKENQLKDLVRTDPKRVRRILRNREHVARLKAQKAKRLQVLERQADALKEECMTLSAQVQPYQEMSDNLKIEIRELQIKINGLNEQNKLSEALNDQLLSEIERLKRL